jgi:hypothetical protein
LCYFPPVLRNITFLAPACLAAATHAAAALELDTLLPSSVPGFGAAQGVTILSRLHPEYQSLGINLGGVSLLPRLQAGAGYDSSPNGAAGASPFGSLTSSLAVTDQAAGLGAYVAGTAEQEFDEPVQNTAGYTLALGERAQFAADVFSAGLALLRTQETGFALNTFAPGKPVSVTATEIRLSDARDFGMFTITPEVSADQSRFGGLPAEDSTNYRQGLTLEFSSGAPARFVTYLHATETQVRDASLNANTYEALFGVADTADDLWDFRLLAGFAARDPAAGSLLMAPVLEASLDWMPGDLDSLSFSIEREIDDPEQESANGYTITGATISMAHEYLRNVIITASFHAAHAAYFSSPLDETIFNAEAAVTWHLNRAVAVGADYQFNDRQANVFAAANENVLTCNLIWTP